MRIPESALREIAEEILRGLGESDEGSRVAAAALVGADMRGVSTHGVNLLRLVSQRAAAGMLELPTRVTTATEDECTAVLDGNNGLGPVAAYRALGLCVEKAHSRGVAMVLLRRANNLGSLGYYTSIAAARDRVVSLLTTNGNPSVAPYGSAVPFFGTNPISIAVPAGEGRSLVLDMSSSVVARGKIRLASLAGESIPEGWALDESGSPTTDPKRALKGSLLPLGGPKGSGLALMIDVLSGVLSGSAYGLRLKSFHELEGATGVGACFIAADIGRFVDPASFAATMADYVAEIKALRRQDGVDEIILPGELELKKEEESRRLGVEVPEAVAKAIDEILAKKGSARRLSSGSGGGSAA
jgi:LDH2 family malate/lactate/ureidoglycolate dehydrogenase